MLQLFVTESANTNIPSFRKINDAARKQTLWGIVSCTIRGGKLHFHVAMLQCLWKVARWQHPWRGWSEGLHSQHISVEEKWKPWVMPGVSCWTGVEKTLKRWKSNCLCMFGATGKGQGVWVSVCFTSCIYGWEMSCRSYETLTECIIGHMKWLIYPKLLELTHRRFWFSLLHFK